MRLALARFVPVPIGTLPKAIEQPRATLQSILHCRFDLLPFCPVLLVHVFRVEHNAFYASVTVTRQAPLRSLFKLCHSGGTFTPRRQVFHRHLVGAVSKDSADLRNGSPCFLQATGSSISQAVRGSVRRHRLNLGA